MIKDLWQEFCKRWNPKSKETAKLVVIKKGLELESEAFEYESKEYGNRWETEYWQWIRVYEYYKDRNADRDYEYQQVMAEKLMKRHHIDRMLIHYNY